MIVTFNCSDSIHVYHEGCGLKPQFPFMVHATILDAQKYLENRGVKAVKVVNYK